MLLFLSTVAALFVSAAALFVLAAGGHGWNASVISATSLLTGPAGAVAWWNRDAALGKRLAAASIVVNLLSDGLLLFLTAREGTEYLTDAWAHVAPVVLVWAVTWSLLQVLPFAAATMSRGNTQP